MTVDSSFLHYLRNFPLVLEVFGHYQQHPLHKASTELDAARSSLGGAAGGGGVAWKQFRSASPLPPSRFAPSPVRSAKTVVFDSAG